MVNARGGALRSYTVGGRPVVDGWSDGEVPPAFNGAVLAPWPNRIRDGVWTSAGTTQQLPINEIERRTALHGLVCWTDWQLIGATGSSVELGCRVAAQPGYPFDLQLGVRWSLDPDGLTCELTASNVGTGSAQFGAATHPFFGFEGLRVDDLALELAAARYLRTDDRLLPVSLEPLAEPLGALAGVSLDTAYTEVARDADGLARARLSGRDGELVVWADEQFGWWQVYTSDMFDRADDRYRRSVAIEAMTCGPDAFNQDGQPDVIRLEPGQRWQGRWGVQPNLG